MYNAVKIKVDRHWDTAMFFIQMEEYKESAIPW